MPPELCMQDWPAWPQQLCVRRRWCSRNHQVIQLVCGFPAFFSSHPKQRSLSEAPERRLSSCEPPTNSVCHCKSHLRDAWLLPPTLNSGPIEGFGHHQVAARWAQFGKKAGIFLCWVILRHDVCRWLKHLHLCLRNYFPLLSNNSSWKLMQSPLKY